MNIVERLRDMSEWLRSNGYNMSALQSTEAADEIERLCAEVATANVRIEHIAAGLDAAEAERDALRQIIDTSDDMRLRLLDAALAERDALRAELNMQEHSWPAMRADALRYRWLRDEKNEGGFAVFQIDDSGGTIRNKIFLGAELDTAIDKDMKESSK